MYTTVGTGISAKTMIIQAKPMIRNNTEKYFNDNKNTQQQQQITAEKLTNKQPLSSQTQTIRS